MNRPIVVPLDGTPLAERALPLALRVATRSGASLHLVRAHAEPASWSFLKGGRSTPAAGYEDRRLRAAAARYLEEAALPLREELGEARVMTALLEGPVAGAVESYCVEGDAALVVMASRRRRRAESLFEKSTMEEILRRTGIPLLIAGSEPSAVAAAGPETFEHVLVAIDGSARSAEVLEHALGLGALDRTRYTLVRVVPAGFLGASSQMAFPRIDPAIGETDLGEAAKRDLERRAAVLRARGYQVDVRLVPSGRAGPTIARVAKEIGADLVAMTPRRRRLAARLLFGSVSADVIRDSASPALIYCPPPPGPAAA